MSSMKDQFVLMVDGKPHTGWIEGSITRSIEQAPFSFTLSLSEIWNAKSQLSRRAIERGMAVQAYINDDLLVSGNVNRVAPTYDKQSHTIKVTGSSRLQDLVRCSTLGQSFRGQSLAQICQQLCKPFGIGVSIDGNVLKAAHQKFTSEQVLDLGQPIWEFLEQLARIRAVMLLSNADGSLVITRAGTGRASTALVLGENVKSAQGEFSELDLFSEYTVTAQQGNDIETRLEGIDTVLPMATVKANGRYRPLVISADNPTDVGGCKTLAEWHKNVNEGRAETITYNLQGWRQENGQIWQPNTLVNVTDAYQELDNAERLIVETRMSIGRRGRLTSLRVAPPEAFALIPQVEQATTEDFIRE